MAFSSTWFLLEQEGLLAQSCLCNGLTALRRASLGDKKGLFFSAFFELSTGFERVLKLVLILDHMGKHRLIPPCSKTVEGYGHKLLKLFDNTKAICSSRGVTVLDAFQPNSLAIVILKFLDDFAHPGGRYSNINKLTGHKHQSMADPIVKWGEIVDCIMREKAKPGQRERAELNGQLANAAFGDVAFSLMSDLNQQPLAVASLYVRASELNTAAKYAIYELVTLIAALCKVIDTLCHSARIANPHGKSGMVDVPDMNEFFQFACLEKKHVMRKRQWP
jgi:hypothetical protein